MRSEWIVKYGNTDIKVVNTWFSGEQLFVNGELQDERLNFLSADLTGHLIDENGVRKNIKANLSGFFKIGCRLFVDDEKMMVTQIK